MFLVIKKYEEVYKKKIAIIKMYIIVWNIFGVILALIAFLNAKKIIYRYINIYILCVGIDVMEFGELMMCSGLVLNDDIRWLSFQG